MPAAIACFASLSRLSAGLERSWKIAAIDAERVAVPSRTDADAGEQPAPHGHAALLIVESLIHVLIAKNLLTMAEAEEVIDVAADVMVDMKNVDEAPNANLRRCLGLIEQISISLRRGASPS